MIWCFFNSLPFFQQTKKRNFHNKTCNQPYTIDSYSYQPTTTVRHLHETVAEHFAGVHAESAAAGSKADPLWAEPSHMTPRAVHLRLMRRNARRIEQFIT